MPDITYRKFLENELQTRQSRNSSYSMRALARDLGLSSTHLNDIMKGKNHLSVDKAELIAKKLQLDQENYDLFMDLVESEYGSNEIAKQRAEKRLTARLFPFKNLSPEEFSPVSAWYYMPLLEMFSTRLESHAPEYLARRLGLPLETMETALETLIQEGLLRRDGPRFVVCEDTSTSSKTPSDVIRRYHQQMLDHARVAIVEQPLANRHISAMTISMSKNKVALAKERIMQFRRQLAVELTEGSDKDAVYTMSICLFENTKDTP
jgi:uncharacterized protein (TIGR02147 family)